MFWEFVLELVHPAVEVESVDTLAFSEHRRLGRSSTTSTDEDNLLALIELVHLERKEVQWEIASWWDAQLFELTSSTDINDIDSIWSCVDEFFEFFRRDRGDHRRKIIYKIYVVSHSWALGYDCQQLNKIQIVIAYQRGEYHLHALRPGIGIVETDLHYMTSRVLILFLVLHGVYRVAENVLDERGIWGALQLLLTFVRLFSCYISL